jgi:hypothetical protein
MRLVDAAHHSEVTIQCTIDFLAFSIWKGTQLGGGLSAGQVHAWMV